MEIAKIVSTLTLLLFACACGTVLGAHVHKFSHQGVNYVKCTVVVDEGNTKLGQESLEICRDAFGQKAPEKH